MRVAVLGCGPAGLAAVHAVRQATAGEATTHVFSRKQVSPLYGAQYLHKPIPWLPDPVPTQDVSYVLQGDVEGYRLKVYGAEGYRMAEPSSVEVLPPLAPAWDIRATYRQLCDLYWPLVTETDVDAPGLRMLVEQGNYDLIVNTIPLQALCDEGHPFQSQEIWAKGSTKELPETGTGGIVICNGRENPAWYRSSHIFGYSTLEWPHNYGRKPPVSGVALVRKPLRHKCTCWPWKETGMLFVGRYGAWRKGYLVHHAYEVVQRVVIHMSGGWLGRRKRLSFDPNQLPLEELIN